MPPLMKQPTGTSLTRRSATERSKRSAISSRTAGSSILASGRYGMS
jgi:hypothetical protein